MTHRSSAFAVTLALLAMLGSCRPQPPKPVPRHPDGRAVEAPPEPDKQQEKAARVLYEQAERAEERGDVESAEHKRDLLLEQHPGTLSAARVLNERARAAAAAGDREAAIDYYEKLLYFRPSYPRADTVRRRYAKLLNKAGRHADAAAMLQALYENADAGSEQYDLGVALVDALRASEQGSKALQILVELQRLPAAAQQQDKISELSLELVDTALDFAEIEALWQDIADDETWRFVQPAVGFKLAKIYYHVREWDNAEAMLQLIIERFPESTYTETARELLARLEARFTVTPGKIGVLLPLSGRYARFGKRSLAAIELALEGADLDVVVKDTAGDPQQARRAVEELVLNEHVIGIIGPLFSNEAKAAALQAEALSVPILSLSHRAQLPHIGDFVFRTALTVQAQARALARVAFERLGMSRFAILHPRNSYGQDFTHAFWDEVDARKGEIRAVESYPHDQTTFTRQVAKLVGRYWVWARKDYRDEVEELKRQDLPSHRYRAELEELRETLPPVVDFDAVIIPDSARNIGLIAPALAVEDVVLEHDPEQLEKLEKALGREELHPVRLLGASTWNTPSLVRSCDHYCEESVFVDAYFPNSPQPRVRDFVGDYKEVTGATPYLSEAQAFDTAGLVRHVVEGRRPASRQVLRSALRKLSNYTGVTGQFHFDEHGEAVKKLFVLTVEEGEIREWEAEETLGG